MLLSFVVPAHNEELELGSCLASIQRAASTAGQRYEVIVVDDASTDRTAAIAREAGARVVSIQRRQIAAARNAGAKAANGEVLFFVDADSQISVAHVSGALDALAAGCSGGGARVTVDREIPMWARIFVQVFCAVYFACNLGAGAFLFTTAGSFRAVGGFDEQYFAGEEIYFTIALKRLGAFVILPTPIITSGRKLRMHSARKILGDTVRLAVGGREAVKSRDRLDLWYDGKRETREL